MDAVNILADVLRYSVPAAIVVIMAVVVFKHLVKVEYRRQSGELRLHAFQALMPLRVQAAERATLFLERINPANSLPRHNATPGLLAKELYDIVIREMNEEYEHNIVQQLYINEAAWALLSKAKIDMTLLLKQTLATMEPTASALDYSSAVFERMKTIEENLMQQAIQILRNDLLRMAR